MKGGDIYLAKLRAKRLLFDYLVVEIKYIENFYTMVGRIVTYHQN